MLLGNPPHTFDASRKEEQKEHLGVFVVLFRLVVCVCVVSFCNASINGEKFLLHPTVLKKHENRNTTTNPGPVRTPSVRFNTKPNRGFQAQWHQCHVRVQLFCGGVTFKCHATTFTSITKLYDASTTTSTAYWDATTVAGVQSSRWDMFFCFLLLCLFVSPFHVRFFLGFGKPTIWGEKSFNQFASG